MMIAKIKEKIMKDRRIGRSSLEAFLEILKEVEAEYINKSSDCSTNGDKIRSMTDEELAEFLPIVSTFLCRPTDECMKIICNRGECENTKDCALNWLKSPTTD